MKHHVVDPTARNIDSDDLAMLAVVLSRIPWGRRGADGNRQRPSEFGSMPGLDAVTVERWAPIIAILLPEFREILLARRAAGRESLTS